MSYKRKPKHKPLSDLQKIAAALYFDHPKFSEIAPLVGVHRCTLWRWYQQPAFRKEINRQCNLRIKEKRREFLRQLRAERAALHKTPEYRRQRQRAYDARRKLKKIEEQLDNATTYREAQELWAKFQKTYNVAYFGGKTPAKYLNSLQTRHDNSCTKKKARKEPKYIVEIVK